MDLSSQQLIRVSYTWCDQSGEVRSAIIFHVDDIVVTAEDDDVLTDAFQPVVDKFNLKMSEANSMLGIDIIDYGDESEEDIRALWKRSRLSAATNALGTK